MATRKIINDPVHSFITIDDDLVLQLINHPYYQRLRRIKQMAMAYLVYPGAVHTRFQHSLGAYHLVCLALQELKDKGTEITPEEMQATKIAILLHDIGHGPFSHALEETLVQVHHEDISLMAMQKLSETFNGALDLAIAVFCNQYSKKYLHQLVSSQLDADRLDYLARDSFFTGVSEGIIGYDRIIKMLAVHNNELVVEEKGIHSIEKFLIARSLMYWQVYLHKTVLSCEKMLVKILHRAKYLEQAGANLFASPSLKVFLANTYDIEHFKSDNQLFNHFMKLDDTDIACAVKVWSNHEDKILSDLSTRLMNRQLYKTKFVSEASALNEAEVRKQVQSKLGIADEDLHYYIIQDSTSNMAYDNVTEPIKILFKDGSLKNITDIENPLINSSIGNPVKKFYICYPQ
jgi:uncharacterized protein